MNQLRQHLAERISLDGPLSIARFMAEALGHPQWGYYISRDPLGRAGDFITAPEVSQMFGELIGLWCADRWRALGAPDPFNLVELGPGRGTLMADALRAAAALPGFTAAARIQLVETSPVLRAAQKQALANSEVNWHDRIADLPPGPAIAIANEFFDALPIRQFQRKEDGWHERMVALREDELCLQLSPGIVPSAPLPDGVQAAPFDAIFEVSPARTAAMSELCQHLAKYDGAALVIDYGHERSAVGDTLQAMRAHEYVDPLAQPGQADLTAHVDFQALGDAAAAAGVIAHGPMTQGGFLQRLGIATRADILRQWATAAQSDAIDAALHRLTDRDEMGQLFKVMAISAADPAPPPGFEEI
ncbi:MAG: SAM-dependent methyltransferase [Alphaproteobacteria bacterium]|jgi:NADH dehydrogenase [ubiquinone] 1 alpha subcomplex assembly factor 7|nr:SAM-dependent methyltransferase [Alphaproteobacteria bacterium]